MCFRLSTAQPSQSTPDMSTDFNDVQPSNMYAKVLTLDSQLLLNITDSSWRHLENRKPISLIPRSDSPLKSAVFSAGIPPKAL